MGKGTDVLRRLPAFHYPDFKQTQAIVTVSVVTADLGHNLASFDSITNFDDRIDNMFGFVPPLTFLIWRHHDRVVVAIKFGNINHHPVNQSHNLRSHWSNKSWLRTSFILAGSAVGGLNSVTEVAKQ